MSDSQQSTSSPQNVNINTRINVYGTVIIFVGGLFSLLSVFVMGVFAITHWSTFVSITAWVVYSVLALVGVLAMVGISWLGIHVYWRYVEARGQKARNQLLHTADNYVVYLERGQVVVQAVAQEKHSYSHRSPSQVEIEEVDEGPPALPAPSQLPTHVRYEDIRGQVPTTRALVGVSEKGIETRDRSIRALLWVVGGSGTGKTNSVSIRVEEDYRRGHRFLVVDPHSFKDDSLYNAVKGYQSRFLLPMAQETADIASVLDFFLAEFERRKAGGKWETPITILIDEVGSLTSFVESEEEEEMVRKLKEVARICGQEARGFEMCGVFISQDAAGLSWLRKRAIMVLAHQVTMWSERILVCNNDSKLARAMDTWPIGRTLVYGIAFQEGPRVLQQPVFSSVGTVEADREHLPYMDALPMRDTSQPIQREPGLQGDLLRVYEACQELQRTEQRVSSRNVEKVTGIDKDRANTLMNTLASQGWLAR